MYISSTMTSAYK